MNMNPTTNEVFIQMPNNSLFKFTGVGSNNLLYQKINNDIYRRVVGYNSKYVFPSSIIEPSQGIRIVVEEEI
jgi:hypothetical protein